LRSVRARFLALLLVLAIWPSTGETAEYVVHWIQYGDAAHAAGDAHEESPIGADEHGCSGMFHLCSCHAPSQGTLPRLAELAPHFPPADQRPLVTPTGGHGCEARAPLIRPPIV
jgi:hypothetical protein